MNTIGTLRPLSWAIVWASMGHEITVITSDKIASDEPLDLQVDLKNIKVISIENTSLIRNLNPRYIRILKFLKYLIPGLTLFAQPRNKWYNHSINFLKKNSFDYDFMFSTSGPIASHLIAAYIKKKNPKIYWVSDFRDLWSQLTVRKITKFEKIVAMIFEKKIISMANLISSVSIGMNTKLSKLHEKNVYVSYNGFEEPIYSNEVRNGVSNFIVYTGSFIDGYHDVSVAVRALTEFNKLYKPKVKLRVYGNRVDGIKKYVSDNNLDDVVEFLGYRSRKEILNAQKNADFCLLLSNNKNHSDGDISGKFFEYLNSNRPIICLNTIKHGELDQLLKLTGTGVNIHTVRELVDIFEQFYLNNNETEFFSPKIEQIKKFSRRNQAILLLDYVTGKSNSN